MNIKSQLNELRVNGKTYESLNEEDLEGLIYGDEFQERLARGECKLVSADEFLEEKKAKYGL